MQELEAKIKSLIIEKYGSLKKFSETIDMPWTTLDSILKRGMANSNITNVLKITRELGLDADLGGESSVSKPAYILVKLRHWQQFMRDNPAEYTEDELKEIRQFAEFVKGKRR